MFDYKSNDYFALVTPIVGGWSFVSYELDGVSYRAIQGFNRDGMPRNFTIFFGDRERMYISPKNKTIQVIVNNDMKNVKTMKISEYLLKSGYCVGEFCKVPIFKLIDEDKDAKEVVDIKTFRIEAESAAVALKGDDLREMANMLGEFSDDKNRQKRMVLEFAGKNPQAFTKLLEDPNRSVKALVQKAIKAGIMRKAGKVVTWEKEVTVAGGVGTIMELIRIRHTPNLHQ